MCIRDSSDILRTAHKARIGRRLIRGVRYEGPWLDIGDPQAYLETNLSVLRGELKLALDPFERAVEPPPGVTTEGPVWIGKGAVIEKGAHLCHAIIGANARIGAVRVENSVVWDGVELSESIERSVAFERGILNVEPR